MIDNVNNIPKIFILDVEHSFISFVSEILMRNIKCEIYTFETFDSFINYKYLSDADLFIVDLLLGSNTGFEAFDFLKERGLISPPPILFTSGHDSNRFTEDLKRRESMGVFDYIEKPFEVGVLLNRVSLLLKMNQYQKDQKYIRSQYETLLWNTIYYSNFYFLVLDCSLNIKRINNRLKDDLALEGDCNRNITEYMTENYKNTIPDICEKLIGIEDSHLELFFDVKKKNGDILSVKWFITFINNGHDLLLCIGIPYIKESDESIKNMREYYRILVEKDKKMISSIKNKIENNIYVPKFNMNRAHAI